MSPSEFETLLNNLKKLPAELKKLMEKRIELFSLEIGERISRLITNALYRVVGVIFLSLGMILVLFAAANFVGELLNSDGLGFIVVAAPILILGLLFATLRPRFMVTATRNRMLQQFMTGLGEQIGKSGEKENPPTDS